ncbi:PilZ domain-containing protein [Methylosarcina fibrata]|uniref:PilZ domain-containing protein n=1 Tax=Methylosarcina fibrata TaxID=105972 RepID=UPI00037568A9|nr:PilZ domain-containing protein [Methylosarcina fibrata]
MVRAENRRQYFRIEDTVELNYRIIDEQDVTESSQNAHNILNECTLSSLLDSISEETGKLLHRMEKSHPDVTPLLKLLDSKIDLIAQSVMLQINPEDKKNTRAINLSASGLAFHSDKAIEPERFLELRLMLLSFRVLMVTCGRVVQCTLEPESPGGSPYLISADFISMREQDRDLLIQHLVKRQIQQIKAKKKKL